jgi:outer membrane protein OmpA-like peptidoglycan-associated protein
MEKRCTETMGVAWMLSMRTTWAVLVVLGAVIACTSGAREAARTVDASRASAPRDAGKDLAGQRLDARPGVDARRLRTVVIPLHEGVEGVAGCDGDPAILPFIRFAAAKASLDRKEDVLLQKVVACTKRFPALRLSIQGHTDRAERVANLQVLSDERARAVRDRLVALGADPGRLNVSGFGARRPLSRARSARGHALNRRVEFTVINVIKP